MIDFAYKVAGLPGRRSACSWCSTSSATTSSRACAASRCCASRSASAASSPRGAFGRDRHGMGAVGDPARRLRQDGRRARRRRARRRTCARAFNRQSVWKRIAIVAAGPIANLLLAVLLFAGTYMAGVPGTARGARRAAARHAAAAAGIRAGDLVVAVDGEPVRSWQDLRWRLTKAQGREAVALAIEPAGPHAGDPPVDAHARRSASSRPADWEGNALGDARPARRPRAAAHRGAGRPASRAKRAGLKAGDRIVAIDGAPVRSPGDVATTTNAKPGRADRVPRRARRRDART